MKKTSAHLATIAGIVLIAIASSPPAQAGTKRQHADSQWRQGGPDIVVKDGVRRRSGGERRSIGQERRYFLGDPGRNFGVGPDSYECFGYDCNW
jgi:hypothetical protein